MLLSIESKEDREKVVAILAKNGYVVKITRARKSQKSNAYNYFVECKEASLDESLEKNRFHD